MKAILLPHQQAYLATFLSTCTVVRNKVNRNSLKIGHMEIVNKLSQCTTKEQLYEVLEDFADIPDPMFDILLEVLI